MSDSIGNLKNSGLQGNNWPWQHKVLEGLQGIYNALTGAISGQQRIAKITSVTGAGTIAAGKYSYSIANVGAGSGTVDGVTVPAGTTVSFDGSGVNNTLTAMPYNATCTTFIITSIE
jgi:hypothetical protein